jgi:hypothetical protein
MKEKGRLFGFSSYLKEHLISTKNDADGEPVERQVEYLVKEHLEMTYPGICSPQGPDQSQGFTEPEQTQSAIDQDLGYCNYLPQKCLHGLLDG